MYSCVDEIYMVQLLNILGPCYVVWDKSAFIRFRRPGKETLYAEFQLTDEFLEQISTQIETHKERDFELAIELVNANHEVHAPDQKSHLYRREGLLCTKEKGTQSKLIESSSRQVPLDMDPNDPAKSSDSSCCPTGVASAVVHFQFLILTIQ